MYICQNCGYISKKWLGKCPECNSWNSFLEENVDIKKVRKVSDIPNPVSLHEIKLSEISRVKTNIEEFNRVLGGGLVEGEVILIGGAPGIGKSTLLSQVLDVISNENSKGFYLSAEESLNQIKLRFSRLGITNENILFLSENNLTKSIETIRKVRPKFIVIDSIQTIYVDYINSIPGSVSQIRECSSMLIEYTKKNNAILFLIGHITKEGSIAGPKILEHMVDAVLYFESEKNNAFRIIRSLKNRFGPVNEIAVFEMTSKGLKEVKNPSEIFLDKNKTKNIGSTVFPAIEGTRSILLEVQALVSDTNFSIPRRTSQGVDLNRLNLLIAIIEKNLGANLFNKDIFINIPGGIKINDPAIDLPVVMAILSSYLNKEIDQNLVCFGEIGLTGEVRNASFSSERIKEAIRLGYKKIVTPERTEKVKNAEIITVNTINDIFNILN